jgi:hypothetical protein
MLTDPEANGVTDSPVLTQLEKRSFLARIVRARIIKLPEDSDLWQTIKPTKEGNEFRLPDKLRALRQDNDLAGEDTAPEANDTLKAFLDRIMQ